MIVIGSVSIENVGGSANVQFGNIINEAPVSSSKTTSGAGSGNEGMLMITYPGFSLTTSIPSTSGSISPNGTTPNGTTPSGTTLSVTTPSITHKAHQPQQSQ